MTILVSLQKNGCEEVSVLTFNILQKMIMGYDSLSYSV